VDYSELLSKCLRGDNAAWEEFVLFFYPLVKSAARLRLEKYGIEFTRQDLEDIAQGVFYMLVDEDYKRLRTLREPECLEEWLAVVAGNFALNFVKKNAREVSIGEAESISWDDEEDAELADILEYALGKLTEKERLVIKMIYLFGMKHREVAETLGIPVGTVSSIASRALVKLRGILKKYRLDDFLN